MTPSSSLDLLYKDMPAEPDGTEEELAHFFGTAVYARRVRIRKDSVARFHVHSYDHLAIVAIGHGRLMKDTGIVEVKAGDCVEIKTGERHAFLADEDLVFYCVHGDVEEARRLYGGMR